MPFFFLPMIELRDVSFSFPSPRESSGPVLAGINLRIPPRGYVALMGPNGSGKSTLGKLIKGLLSPTTGEVLIGGIPLKPGEISARVGYIFSNPENQIISSVVEEDVAFGLENLGLEPAEIVRKVQQSLAWVGMEEYRYHAPHLLSGGQQQKVVLAGILAMGSEILVLDEPTSMLDLQGRREILNLLQKFHAQGNKTILHITHSLEEALRAGDLIFLNRGRIEFSQSVTEFLARGRWLEDYGITPPPLQQLIADLRAHGYAIPLETASVAELKSSLLGLKEGR
ncbi:MAG: transporter related [Deltaproteobacteria bacterium]|nr:transporter related [Deltaproteobacteria bacterium]